MKHSKMGEFLEEQEKALLFANFSAGTNFSVQLKS